MAEIEDGNRQVDSESDGGVFEGQSNPINPRTTTTGSVDAESDGGVFGTQDTELEAAEAPSGQVSQASQGAAFERTADLTGVPDDFSGEVGDNSPGGTFEDTRPGASAIGTVGPEGPEGPPGEDGTIVTVSTDAPADGTPAARQITVDGETFEFVATSTGGEDNVVESVVVSESGDQSFDADTGALTIRREVGTGTGTDDNRTDMEIIRSAINDSNTTRVTTFTGGLPDTFTYTLANEQVIVGTFNFVGGLPRTLTFRGDYINEVLDEEDMILVHTFNFVNGLPTTDTWAFTADVLLTLAFINGTFEITSDPDSFGFVNGCFDETAELEFINGEFSGSAFDVT